MTRSMARTSTFPLADLAMGGELADFLRAARDRKDSFETIAFTLRRDHDLVVSTATIRRWCDALAPEESASEAS